MLNLSWQLPSHLRASDGRQLPMRKAVVCASLHSPCVGKAEYKAERQLWFIISSYCQCELKSISNKCQHMSWESFEVGDRVAEHIQTPGFFCTCPCPWAWVYKSLIYWMLVCEGERATVGGSWSRPGTYSKVLCLPPNTQRLKAAVSAPNVTDCPLPTPLSL